MRLLVVSHPAILPVNQEIYRELAERGVEVMIVVPAQWRHEYARETLAPVALPRLADRFLPLRVAFAGRPQRHFYLARPGRVTARTRPDIAFVEAEAYAIAAAQWAFVLARRRIPFGVQAYENIDRSLPSAVRVVRNAVLRRASFVVARSESAAHLVRAWGARGRVAIVPPAVPGWKVSATAPQTSPFTIGYAGRLVPEKGLGDLLAAVRRLEAPVELLLVGDGPLRTALEGQRIPGSRVCVLAGVSHDAMPGAYARMDVLVLPSRTTPRWREQFGRVIVEALWCGVPVVGSDSGEIPSLIRRTRGGVIFPEGNFEALAEQLAGLRASPAQRAQFAAEGRAAVERMFTVRAAATGLLDLLETSKPLTTGV